MTDSVNYVYETIDREHAGEPAATRRQLVAGAAGVLGGMGLLGGLPHAALARDTDKELLLNVAATAEALATIVNTVGAERVNLDAVTRANLQSAAREELIHYEVLTSTPIGARALTTRIWVPDAVFTSQESVLRTLVTGDQIFINLYLVAVTTFGNEGDGRLARISAEFMGVEAVHRALALQSLQSLGTDRAFMKYSQAEQNPVDLRFPNAGARTPAGHMGFLAALGFGFGEQGATPGAFYEHAEVARRTPDPSGVNTRSPR